MKIVMKHTFYVGGVDRRINNFLRSHHRVIDKPEDSMIANNQRMTTNVQDETRFQLSRKFQR